MTRLRRLIPLLLTLAFVAPLVVPTTPAYSQTYPDLMQVPIISGTREAQLMVGQAIIDAETQGVGFLFSGDSRHTWPAGSGKNMTAALCTTIPTLTSHGRMPKTPMLYFAGSAAAVGYAGPIADGKGGDDPTGRVCTSPYIVPPQDPSPQHVINNSSGTIHISAVPPPSTNGTWFVLDPACRSMPSLLRSRNITTFPRDAPVRAKVLLQTNPVSSPTVLWHTQYRTVWTNSINDTGTTAIANGTWDTSQLASATLNTYTYYTDYFPVPTLTTGVQFQCRVTAGDANRVELISGQFESQDPKGIWIQTLGQGSALVTTLMSERPQCGPTLQANGPFRVAFICCNVNDAGQGAVEPPQWETNVRQAIIDLRSLTGQADLPCVVWIQCQSVQGAAEAATTTRFSQYPGAAKHLAENMKGVVAINTARVMREKWFGPTQTWVPGGNYIGGFNGAATYAVGDVIQFVSPAPGFDNKWYRCKTATVAGESPSTAAAKWRSVQDNYDPLATYEFGDCVTYAGTTWGNWAFLTPVAGQEPGVHVNWVETIPYPSTDRVHQNDSGAQIMVDELTKSLRTLRGYAEGRNQAN